jgi:hypothetical protein
MRNLAVVPDPIPELSPVRAQLACLLESQAEAREKRAAIVAAGDRLKQAEETEATARAALDALDATEAAAMGTWAETGGDMPSLDAEARQRLMGDLARASATAKAARSAGERMLAEAREAQANLDDIAAELRSGIHGVLVAELEPVFAELAEVENRRRQLMATAISLGTLLREGADKFDVGDAARIPILSRSTDIQNRLRAFAEPQPIANGEVDAHRSRFVALANRLATDPRATLED